MSMEESTQPHPAAQHAEIPGTPGPAVLPERAKARAEGLSHKEIVDLVITDEPQAEIERARAA
jgi:hypothetical protein